MLKRQVKRTIRSQQIPLPDPPLPVPANKKILVWVGDELLPRDSAKVFVTLPCGMPPVLSHMKILPFLLSNHQSCKGFSV